jgi:methylase of polypeptide subunit release factors
MLTHTRLQFPAVRKALGAYYTPAVLIDLLLKHALAPNSQPLRILDPACGPGDFLLAIHQRLRESPGSHLFGCDIDPDAANLCKAALLRDGIKPDHFQIDTADALLNPPASFEAYSFDLIVGNPPFVNGIEGNLTAETKRQLREKYASVRGAADLAHFFLAQAVELVRPSGRIALVLPRALLNSPAARTFRANLPSHLRPNFIYAPERSDFFPGAAIFICLLILGPDQSCRVSTDPDPAAAQFHTVEITGDNWWLALHPSANASDSPDSTAASLHSQFQVAASMTAGDAYDVVPHLIDNEQGTGLKLVTTGLIEPNQCLWGQVSCRYLKKNYLHPRIKLSGDLSPSLAIRVKNAARPKILVAGLSRKIEAFLDDKGQYLGAVSTFTIYHPQDDIAALSHLLQHLLSPATTEHLISHLGANGLRGRHITVKKSFLRDLRL